MFRVLVDFFGDGNVVKSLRALMSREILMFVSKKIPKSTVMLRSSISLIVVVNAN